MYVFTRGVCFWSGLTSAYTVSCSVALNSKEREKNRLTVANTHVVMANIAQMLRVTNTHVVMAYIAHMLTVTNTRSHGLYSTNANSNKHTCSHGYGLYSMHKYA